MHTRIRNLKVYIIPLILEVIALVIIVLTLLFYSLRASRHWVLKHKVFILMAVGLAVLYLMMLFVSAPPVDEAIYSIKKKYTGIDETNISVSYTCYETRYESNPLYMSDFLNQPELIGTKKKVPLRYCEDIL